MKWMIEATIFVILILISIYFINNATQDVRESQQCEKLSQGAAACSDTCEPGMHFKGAECPENQICCLGKSSEEGEGGGGPGTGSTSVSFIVLQGSEEVPIGEVFKTGKNYRFKAYASGDRVDKCIVSILYTSNENVDNRLIKRTSEFDCEQGSSFTQTFEEEHVGKSIKMDVIAFKQDREGSKWLPSNWLSSHTYPIEVRESESVGVGDGNELEPRECPSNHPPTISIDYYTSDNPNQPGILVGCHDEDDPVDPLATTADCGCKQIRYVYYNESDCAGIDTSQTTQEISLDGRTVGEAAGKRVPIIVEEGQYDNINRLKYKSITILVRDGAGELASECFDFDDTQPQVSISIENNDQGYILSMDASDSESGVYPKRYYSILPGNTNPLPPAGCRNADYITWGGEYDLPITDDEVSHGGFYICTKTYNRAGRNNFEFLSSKCLWGRDRPWWNPFAEYEESCFSCSDNFDCEDLLDRPSCQVANDDCNINCEWDFVEERCYEE